MRGADPAPRGRLSAPGADRERLGDHAGGYNCLHQDIYGDVVFPLQMTCLLSRPGQDFTGGEFLWPRVQSTRSVVPLERGQIVIFAAARGARGAYRVTLRHGVGRVTSGERHTLGVIFHDAK